MSRTSDTDVEATLGREGYVYDPLGDKGEEPLTGIDPFYSSIASHDWKALGFPSLKTAKFWDVRSCGVACLRMVYGRLKPDVEALPATVTEELLRDGAYSEEFGWNHEGLASHAMRHGLKAERLQFSTPKAFIDVARKPGTLVVSIGHSFDRDSKSDTLRWSPG